VTNLTPAAARVRALDHDLVERGLRGHSDREAALAAALRSLGTEPRSPHQNEPPFDIAWVWDGALFVAEVKSISTDNEEHQLWLGLGQLLRYVHWLTHLHSGSVVRGVLVPERSPANDAWFDVCRTAAVALLPAPALPAGLIGLMRTVTMRPSPAHLRSVASARARP
jgi:hypothetical protein